QVCFSFPRWARPAVAGLVAERHHHESTRPASIFSPWDHDLSCDHGSCSLSSEHRGQNRPEENSAHYRRRCIPATTGSRYSPGLYRGHLTQSSRQYLLQVDGYIVKLHVDKGDFVRTNQLLLEIDHIDYQHAVNQAKAKLTFDRMQILIKDQFVSQQDLDNAQVNLDAARAAHESLQAQVNQMEVALAQAETNLAYSYIRAPFPGYIAEPNLDTGAYVTSATASTS